MYGIILRNPAKRFFKKLDKDSQKEILKKLENLKRNPRIGKALTGNLRGLWRLRYNQYRIIYRIKDMELIIYILIIGHRKNVYG